MKTESINLVPNWESTAKMLLTILESGNASGKTFARSEILRMGKIIDQLQNEKGESK